MMAVSHDRPAKQPRGKKAPPHLPVGLVLRDILKIERLLNGGGFAQIFKAINLSNNKPVAVKVEPGDDKDTSKRLIQELHLLSALHGIGTKHTPKPIASGNHLNYMYIAMEIVGRNLNDLRHRQQNKRFTIGTGLRVAIQMVEALKDVHSICYLHRDVKPSNMCIGYGDEKRVIFLVDFGMTRRFREKNGEFRKPRTYSGFRGTLRYVSLTVHERKEQGPKDDLYSLQYSIIELCEGSLPWRNIEDDDDMALKKKNTPIGEMILYLPRSIKEISDHLETLSYNSLPNYDLITKVYSNAIPHYITKDSVYDWEAMTLSSKSLEQESASIQAKALH